MTTATHERMAQIQEKVGDAHIHQVLLDLSRLDRDGVFVNVIGGGTSALRTKLSLQALGVNDVPKGLAMKIGSPPVGLLPEEHCSALSSPVHMAYSLVRKYGMSFMVSEKFFGRNQHRWIPWSAFEDFEKAFSAESDRLEFAREHALANYPAIRERMLESFQTLTRQARDNLVRLGHTPAEGFSDTLTAALMDKMPTKEHIQTGIFVRREIGVLLFGSEIEAERAATAESRLKAEITEKEIREREAVIAARARAEYRAEEERQRMLTEDQRKEHQAKEAIRKLKIEEERKMLKDVLSPVQEGAQQLAYALNEAAKEMAESIARNGFVHPKTATRAREMATWFKAMNWQNDAQLEELVSRLGAMATSAPEKRDPIQFDDAVARIISVTKDQAAAAARSGRIAALEL